MMMKEGVFEGTPLGVIFAQHVWPELPVGRVGVRSGVMTGASDRLRGSGGEGGHASKPTPSDHHDAKWWQVGSSPPPDSPQQGHGTR